MVLQVLRQALAAVEPLLQLGVRDVARHDQRSREREPGLDRMAAERLANF